MQNRIDKEIVTSITEILNQLGGCTLTSNFATEVDHAVRVYELTEKSKVNGYEAALEIITQTETLLEQYKAVNGYDSLPFQAVCNEIAYTVLLLLHLPLRLQYLECAGMNFNDPKRIENLLKLGRVITVLHRLKTFNLGIKTKKFYEEMYEIQKSILEELSEKEPDITHDIHHGVKVQAAFPELIEALKAGEFSFYNDNITDLEYRRILHPTTQLRFKIYITTNDDQLYEMEMILVRNNEDYVKTIRHTLIPGLSFKQYDNLVSELTKEIASHFTNT